MLLEHRSLHAGFRARNFKRWRKALNLLETQWVIAQEFVDEFDAKHRKEANLLHDFQFEALKHLHARALLVTREIICLVEGGYADGALSRWRSLHELAVVSAFLSKQDAQVAQRYLASFHFEAYRAAIQLNEYAARAKLRKFSSSELASMSETRDLLEKRFGKGMRENYGWASAALGKDKPNFHDMEISTGLDHWRPRYKWASQHTHGNHRPANSLLGLSESKQPKFLVGASNSGFVDPLQMTAISLNICTAAFLSTKSSIDTTIVLRILSDFAREIGPLAIRIERDSLRVAKTKSKISSEEANKQ